MDTQPKKNTGFLMQGVILAVAGIITRLIGIAYRIPVTNILGVEGQGYYGSAFSIYNIALLLTSYSLPLAVSKLVSARVARRERKNAFRIFKGALIFAAIAGTVACLIVFLFSDFIAGNIMGLKLSAYALRVLAPGLLIVAIMGVVRGYFQGIGTMVPTAISQILEQIVNAIVSIIGASYLLKMGQEIGKAKGDSSIAYAYGAAGGTLGTVCGAFIGLLFLLILFRVYYPVLKKQMGKEENYATESYSNIYRVLILTIAPVILSTAIYNISETIDMGVFSKIMSAQGHSQDDIASLVGRFTGHYNVMINIPLAIANALGAALIPSLTATINSGTKREAHLKIDSVIRFSMLIAIPCFIGFLALANPILALLFSGDIGISANMLRLGAITIVFYCLSTVTNAILQGINRMATPVKHGAISLVIHLVSVVVMLAVFKWNIYALVVGNIVFSFCMCYLNARALKKAIAYKQEWKRTFIIPFVSAFIMGITAIITYYVLDLLLPLWLALFVSILLAVIVYAIALLKLGALSQDEILDMPKGATILQILQKFHLLA